MTDRDSDSGPAPEKAVARLTSVLSRTYALESEPVTTPIQDLLTDVLHLLDRAREDAEDEEERDELNLWLILDKAQQIYDDEVQRPHL